MPAFLAIGRAAGWIVLFVSVVASATIALAADAPRKPNIVVIVADDLGYAEIACDGKQDIPTPHIASIAKNGTCFSNGYVTCPVCSPTRAGLLTGRYQQRFGHELNPGPAQQADPNFGLPLDQVTLPDRLKKLGYATGMVGKWHLGYLSQYHPTKRGFDEFFGFLGGAHSYVDSSADPNNRIWRGEQQIDEPAYLTDAIGREAVAFVDHHKAEPFFLYMPFNAVHAPLQTPPKYRQRFAGTADPQRQTFSAMLSAMDDNVGLLLDKLAADKLDDNTLVFFIADNGGPTRQTTSKNDPLHGFKAQVWEGGIRVPYMVQWKGHIPAGKVYDQPVSSLDIVPTALAAAGAPADASAKLDGVDLVPYLDGKQTARPHDKLYWRFREQWAIRSGDMKLLQGPEGAVQLFDLAKDIGETKNLAADKPDIAQRLKSEYESWNAELVPPKWKTERVAGAGKAKAKGKGAGKKAKAKQAA